MSQQVRVKEYKPCTALLPYISRWVQYEAETILKTKIAPSGKHFINHTFGTPFRAYKDDGSIMVYDQNTYVFGHPLNLQGTAISEIDGKNLICEFTYTGLHRLLHINVDKLIDVEKPIEEIGLLNLNSELFQTSDFNTKQKIFEEYLLSRVPKAIKADREVDNLINSIEQQYYSNFESIGVTNPSDKKRIYRKFKKQTGMSPKQFHRVYQLNTVIRLINEESYKTLSELGLKSGYYDQADFIRHLKNYLKKSPSWLINHEDEMLFIYMGGTNTF